MTFISQRISARSLPETPTVELCDWEAGGQGGGCWEAGGQGGGCTRAELQHPVGSVYYNGVLCDVARVGSNSSAACSLYMAQHEWGSDNVVLEGERIIIDAAAAEIGRLPVSASDESAAVAHSNPPSSHLNPHGNVVLELDGATLLGGPAGVPAVSMVEDSDFPPLHSILVQPLCLQTEAYSLSLLQSSAASACIQSPPPSAITHHTSSPCESSGCTSTRVPSSDSHNSDSHNVSIGSKRHVDNITNSDDSHDQIGRAGSARSCAAKLSRASALDFSGAKMLL
jgi:hypothetical protein